MEPTRRSTDDANSANIESMIAEENDPKSRALLIVLNSINNSMMANTAITREIGGKLDAHLSNYERHVEEQTATVNRGRGAWTVALWGLGLIQTAGIGLGMQIKAEFNALREADLKINTELIQMRIHEERDAAKHQETELRLKHLETDR